MSAAIATPTPTLSRPVPWYVWCGAAAVTFAMVGTHWDISWHRSIGRDSFWTPAHIAIHLCGVLAGISCGYLILSTTLNRQSPLRQCSVTMWGFRGPLGAFLSAWGGVAMITSAPFDNWWHNAYGLDVKILSPPHMVLAAGILAVHVGALILILGQMNRASGVERARLRALFLYVGGMILVTLTVVQMEITVRSLMHTAHFYYVVALVAPLVLAGVARASGYRWAATAVAGVYGVFVLLMSWILPLFPAAPKLGPVNHMVTQFVPPEFPLLLIVPAFALDLLWRRTAHWGGWRQALISGAVFLAVFTAVQWPFANFLMSPAARNWFFGAKYFGYYTSPSSIYARYQFVRSEPGTEFWMQAALGLATAILGMRLGLAAGNWMRLVKR
ncbi:MAG TPA: hypothetical protein VNY05_10315 [Candidatus Acidoferrales bacterium]|jgi:hypothetical protein|nr:hypothetical protein [Candidatus Acidoferrales bacterium]